jgi:hypothetical protein
MRKNSSKIVSIIEPLSEKVGIHLSHSLIANCETIKFELEKRDNPNKNISPFEFEKEKYRQNIDKIY